LQGTDIQDQIHELEDPIHELCGHGKISELSVQRTICEKRREASLPEPAVEPYHQDTQQLVTGSPASSMEDNHPDRNDQYMLALNPISRQIPEQAVQIGGDQASPVDLPDLSYSPISPVSSMSSVGSPDRFIGPSTTTFQANSAQLVNIVGADVIEPMDSTTISDSHRSDHIDYLNMKEELEFTWQHPDAKQWLENNIASGGADASNDSLSTDGRKQLVIESTQQVHARPFPWNSWEQPPYRQKLLKSVAHSVQTLPLAARYAAGLCGKSPEACVSDWNDLWRSTWDSLGTSLSEMDLPAFLVGWSTVLIDHAIQVPVIIPAFAVAKQLYPQVVSKPVGGSANQPSTSLSSSYMSMTPPKNWNSANVGTKSKKRRFDDGWARDADSCSKPSDSRQTRKETGENCHGASSMSPPLTQLYVALLFSLDPKLMVFHSSHGTRIGFSPNPSNSSTPSTEAFFADKVIFFSSCQVPGCRATFSGDTLDVRKGNHTRHMKTHNGERFYCNECASHYNRFDNLLKHIRKSHPELGLPPAKRRRMPKREICASSGGELEP
jgi:hypothetical protein